MNDAFKKKSIVFIYGLVYPYSNGVGNCTMQRAEVLAANGLDVSIVTNQVKDTDPIFEEYKGIKIYRVFHFKYANFALKPFYLLKACWDGFKTIKKISPDIIYAPLLYYGFLSAIYGELLDKISITEAQGSDVIPGEVKGIFNKTITWISLKFNNFVISTNEEFKDAMKKRVPDRKIYILPNFINPASVRQNRKKIELDKNKFHIMTVGRLITANNVEIKGISYIIKAMNKLDNCVLHIFGEGHLLQDFKKYVEENNLKDRVVFYGQVMRDVILDYLDSVDVFILASLTEGFNMTVLESAALGTAVISTPLGGQKDYIINEENGLFINLADADSIVEQVKKIRDNEKFKEKLAENIYQTYLEKYVPEVWMKDLFKIINKYENSNIDTK